MKKFKGAQWGPEDRVEVRPPPRCASTSSALPPAGATPLTPGCWAAALTAGVLTIL